MEELTGTTRDDCSAWKYRGSRPKLAVIRLETSGMLRCPMGTGRTKYWVNKVSACCLVPYRNVAYSEHVRSSGGTGFRCACHSLVPDDWQGAPRDLRSRWNPPIIVILCHQVSGLFLTPIIPSPLYHQLPQSTVGKWSLDDGVRLIEITVSFARSLYSLTRLFVHSFICFFRSFVN